MIMIPTAAPAWLAPWGARRCLCLFDFTGKIVFPKRFSLKGSEKCVFYFIILLALSIAS